MPDDPTTRPPRAPFSSDPTASALGDPEFLSAESRLASIRGRDLDSQNLDGDPGWAEVEWDQGSEPMPGSTRTSENRYEQAVEPLTGVADWIRNAAADARARHRRSTLT
ncbi:MAG TPA: hypothetical protein VEB19_07450 [Gemmatimonadaceae bacterium]|nr:hypothetical protein [Gemmatimonadaceae bacterium]